MAVTALSTPSEGRMRLFVLDGETEASHVLEEAEPGFEPWNAVWLHH